MASTCIYRCWVAHSSLASSSTAPIRRRMDASPGKMPTTSALRFTSFRSLQPSVWGKASTFVQVMAAVAVMGARAYNSGVFLGISSVLLKGVVILAIISGIDYSLRGIGYLRAVLQRR